MARARTALPSADEIRALVDKNGRLSLRVTPGARIEALEIASGKLTAKVRAAPEGGKANEAVRALLARGLGLAPSRLTLERGATSRDKTFRVEG